MLLIDLVYGGRKKNADINWNHRMWKLLATSTFLLFDYRFSSTFNDMEFSSNMRSKKKK